MTDAPGRLGPSDPLYDKDDIDCPYCHREFRETTGYPVHDPWGKQYDEFCSESCAEKASERAHENNLESYYSGGGDWAERQRMAEAKRLK